MQQPQTSKYSEKLQISSLLLFVIHELPGSSFSFCVHLRDLRSRFKSNFSSCIGRSSENICCSNNGGIEEKRKTG
jgi:hypothetical protein